MIKFKDVYIKVIGKNIGFLTIAASFGSGASFIVNAYLGRLLGPQYLGVFAISFAFTTIAFRMTTLGLDIITTREVARNKDLSRSYAQNILTLRFLIVILITIASTIIASFLYPSQTVIVIFFLSLHWGFYTLSFVYFTVFRGHEQMHFESFSSLVYSFLIVIGGFIIAKYTESVVYIAILFALTTLAQFIFIGSVFAVKFSAPPRLGFDFSLWKYALFHGFPLGIATLFQIIHSRADIVILSIFQTEEQVGWYSAAYNLMIASGLVSTVIMSALLPRFSILYQQNRHHLRQLYLTALILLGTLGLFALLLGSLFAEELVTLIYGPNYKVAVFVFKVLAWAILFQYLSSLCGILLVSIDKVRINMKVMIFAAIFKLTLNLIFIPALGMIAASFMTVITEFIVFLIMFAYLEIFFRKQGHSYIPRQEVATIN